MRTATECASYFMDKAPQMFTNTYDGDMKMQKLLTLADMVSIANNGKPLFADNVLAFENGCVVEDVRQAYSRDFFGFKRNCEQMNVDFTESEVESLEDTFGIFGSISARELSGLNHTFKSWQDAYARGTSKSGYHSKADSIIDFSLYPQDIESVKQSVEAYKSTAKLNSNVVNGVTFYYDGQFDDELTSALEKFTRECDDDTYTVSKGADGSLEIY